MKTFLFAVLLFSIGSTSAHAQADFYKGKTIRLVIGYSAGGTNDLWARAIARFWGKHIPGNPDFIVQNMPGAATMIAANYIYGVEKSDGLTLGLIAPALFFNQLGGQKEVKFDWAKFAWIGSPEETSEMLSMRSDTPFKTLDDIRQAATPPKCGTTGAGTPGHYFPRLLEEVLGLKFNLVTGYPGANDIDLAIEKGEVQCRAGTTSAFFGREPGRTWAKTGFVRIMVIGGSKRDERAPNVPTIWEVMEKHKTPDAGKRLTTVIALARLLWPADRRRSRYSRRSGQDSPRGFFEGDERSRAFGRGGKAPLGTRSRKRGEASGAGARGGYPTARSHHADERGAGKLGSQVRTLSETF